MSKQPYIIVSAPNISVLEMMVEAYLDQGLVPTGGLLIDSTDSGKIYLQAMWQPRTESQLEDWTQNPIAERF